MSTPSYTVQHLLAFRTRSSLWEPLTTHHTLEEATAKLREAKEALAEIMRPGANIVLQPSGCVVAYRVLDSNGNTYY